MGPRSGWVCQAPGVPKASLTFSFRDSRQSFLCWVIPHDGRKSGGGGVGMRPEPLQYSRLEHYSCPYWWGRPECYRPTPLGSPLVTYTKAGTLPGQPPGGNSCVYLFVIYEIVPLANCWLWGASTQLEPASKSGKDQDSDQQLLSAGTDLMILLLPQQSGQGYSLRWRLLRAPRGGRSGFLKTHKSS